MPTTAWSTAPRLRPPARAADLRATNSSSISAVRVAPQRSAPASMTSISASRVRTPPAALTLTRGDTRRAHQSQVLERRAARREPGRRLDVVGAGSLGRLAAADDLVLRQVGVLEDDLDDRPSGHGVHDRADVGLDLVVHPGSQPADVDDHVELGRTVPQRPDGLEHLRLRLVRPVGEADDGPDRDVRALQEFGAEERRRPVGRTPTRRRSARRSRSPRGPRRGSARVEGGNGRWSWRPGHR